MAIRLRLTSAEARHPRWQRNDLSRHLSFALALLALTLLSVYSDWLQRVDLLIYDTHQQYLSRPAPADVVIVGVDEYSLSQLGRWPWPRRIHAQLIDRLTRIGTKAIMLDIIFTEPDQYDPEGDQLLAQAIRRNGSVVLPVLFEQRYIGGQLVETLPLPKLIASAHSLGHAHVELDTDGITRSVYLKEGLGDAYWSHLSISLLELTGTVPTILPGDPNPATGPPTFNTLQRGNYVMTPYAGPPGHFKHLSYAKLLEGDAPAPGLVAELKDKIVLIGATASGLGDLLPTPVSALKHPMAGVEINANIFDALRQGLIIEPLSLETKLFLSALIALLPVLLFPRLSPRAALLMSILLISATLALTSLLLTRQQIWFPPAAALLALIFAYPLWSWRRLEYANQFLSQELKRINEEPTLLTGQSRDIESTMAFVKNILPIKGWSLYEGSSHCIARWGEPLTPPNGPPPEHSSETWHNIHSGKREFWLGIMMSQPRPPTQEESRLIRDVIAPYLDQSANYGSTSIELFEERVMQLQEAENRIRAMRRLLDDSLNQMANGILIINNLGQLVFINAKALDYLDIDSDAQALRERPVIPLLGAIDIDGIEQWPQLLARTLVNAAATQANGHTPKGLDLLIQLNPLSLEQQHINGVIINLSDISEIRANERQRLETFSFLSHDLRSPLVSLLALVEVSREKNANTTLDRAFLERIETYANRTLTLADDFLQVSQLEHRVDLNFETVDIGLIAANAVDAVWDDSSRKNIKVSEEIPSEPIYVKGDPNLIERALLNLLNNAIKYSPEGATIHLTLKLTGDTVCCCIKDTGFGIAEDALEKIFERYFRIDDPDHSNIPGSGLGLSFVKSVVEKHGGTITVESKAGQGSQFCLHLPHSNDDTTP